MLKVQIIIIVSSVVAALVLGKEAHATPNVENARITLAPFSKHTTVFPAYSELSPPDIKLPVKLLSTDPISSNLGMNLAKPSRVLLSSADNEDGLSDFVKKLLAHAGWFVFCIIMALISGLCFDSRPAAI